MHRVLTTDLKAINHVLTRADVFEKPILAQRALAGVFGNGLLVSEGDAHRAQRRVMNPAFGPGHVRDLTGIFLDKANEASYPWTWPAEAHP
jgi:cytochrome P450